MYKVGRSLMDLRCQHLKSWLPSFPSPELPKLTSLLIIWPQIWRSCCKSLGEQATILSPGLQLLKLMANLSQIQQQHMDESKDFSNSLGAPFELLCLKGRFQTALVGKQPYPRPCVECTGRNGNRDLNLLMNVQCCVPWRRAELT